MISNNAGGGRSDRQRRRSQCASLTSTWRTNLYSAELPPVPPAIHADPVSETDPHALAVGRPYMADAAAGTAERQ
ncbi:MAG TPA: hypothetical protein VJ862_13725, partial [Rhodanobacteraceae bacterium]|nr:hypothetical protein [Rhodanobacteraceae bacterium]